MGMPLRLLRDGRHRRIGRQVRHRRDALALPRDRSAAGRCTDRARRCGLACPPPPPWAWLRLGREPARPAAPGKLQAQRPLQASCSAVRAWNSIANVCLNATSCLVRLSGYFAQLPPTPSVPPKVSFTPAKAAMPGGGVIAEYLLVVLVEHVFHTPEHLHARLQLVGGRQRGPASRHRASCAGPTKAASVTRSFVCPL